MDKKYLVLAPAYIPKTVNGTCNPKCPLLRVKNNGNGEIYCRAKWDNWVNGKMVPGVGCPRIGE